MMRHDRFLAAAAVVSLVAVVSPVRATPYASNVVKTGTSVSFTLNEASDILTYSINGGAATPLGDGTGLGTHTFTLGLPTDTFTIKAEKTSAVGYTIPTGNTNPGPPGQTNGFSQPTAQSGFNQINNDIDPQNLWSAPRGIDVNRNPNTANFGTYYVGIGNQGTGTHSRGIFAYRADTSVAYGDGVSGYNPTLPDASTSAFTNGQANSPYHLTVAPDGTLWEAGYSDANSNILQLDPNLGTATAQNIFKYTGVAGAPSGLGIGPSPPLGADPLTGTGTTFPQTPDGTALSPWPGCLNCTTEAQNHGSVVSVYVTGSLATNNLKIYTIDEDMTGAHVDSAGFNGTKPTANPDYTRNGKVGAEDYVFWRKNKDTIAALNGDQGFTDFRTLFGSTFNDRNSLWKYDIGNNGGNPIGAGITTLPTQIYAGVTTPAIPTAPDGLIGDFPQGGVIADMTVGPDGKFYFSQNRAAGNQPGLLVTDSSGNLLFNSMTASRTLLANPTAVDILSGVNQIQITPDGKYLAIMINSSDVGIIPLIGGIPDLANRLLVDSSLVNGENSGRDITIDAAGNIYYVSSGQGKLRILSPGGHTVATTSWNGASYAFNVATIPGSGSLGGGSVPEPGTLVLALTGMLALGFGRRRQ